jgi:hypothetical protein
MSKTSESSEYKSPGTKENWYESSVRDREAYLELSKTILSLLKEPVSMSKQGANGNRGRQC